MTLDLSLPALLDAGGGLAFVLVGALAFLSGGGGRDRLLLATTCVAFGAVFVFLNLWLPDEAAPIVGIVLAGAIATVACLALVARLARPLPRATRIALVVAVAAALLVIVWRAFAQADSIGAAFGASATFARSRGLAIVFSAGLSLALLSTSAVMGLRAREGDAGWAMLGVGLGLFPVLNGPRVAAFAPLDATFALVAALASVVAIACWLARRPRAAWTLTGAALAGLLIGLASAPRGNANFDYGAAGIARTVAALLVAIGILRHHALGIEPPAFAKRRGALAATALALLFVVAQLAQNFFVSQYSLLMGSIVAGAFLFAAKPIEQALTRRELVATVGVGAEPSARGDELARRVYRDAVRHALRDRAMTRAEELHLADLAQGLGLPAGEALRLRHEVEDEMSAR